MADVGERAGVSHQTVSRYLNGTSYVSAETRERVELAISELGFRPNRSARSLALSRTETIGVITMGGAGQGLLAEILNGIAHAAARAGFSVSVSNLEVSPDEKDAEALISAAFERFLAERVDGVIVVSAFSGVIESVRRAGAEIPIVLIFGQPTEGVGTATIDSFEGGRLAAQYLLSLGHTKIIHVGGPANRFDSLGREEGFISALTEHQIELVDVVRGDWFSVSGYAVGTALAARSDFTAIFSANDQMALGIIHALAQAGRFAPADYSIVGYDDIPDAAHYLPPLTTIRQDFRLIGQRSFGELKEAISTGTYTDVSISPTLVVRESTRPQA
jgi:DNA-binding LacI/PurR family transcriptional regulator